MKKQLLALIGLGLLLATASAYAQSGVVKANVPFNFIVNNTQLPAGEYRISPIGIASSAMAIQSPDRKAGLVFSPNACESLEPSKTTKLVFHRYGDRYFLAEIWIGFTGRSLTMSSAEKEEMASGKPREVGGHYRQLRESHRQQRVHPPDTVVHSD